MGAGAGAVGGGGGSSDAGAESVNVGAAAAAVADAAAAAAAPNTTDAGRTRASASANHSEPLSGGPAQSGRPSEPGSRTKRSRTWDDDGTPRVARGRRQNIAHCARTTTGHRAIA